MDREMPHYSQQLTFSEKLIEADMARFRNSSDVRYYKSAKTISEQDKAPYVFGSMKKELSKDPQLALKMNLVDGSYWNCLQIIASNRFAVGEILDVVYHIYKHTDGEDFDLLTGLASEKLFKYVFIGDETGELDLEEVKSRNRFIQVALSYFNLANKKTDAEVEEWESDMEEIFDKDRELAGSYHKYWASIEDYHKERG